MRLGTAQRRRSWAWWGVFFIALVTIGAYVIFDILDVDGSQMTGWPATDIITTEALAVAADRFLLADSFTSDSSGPIYLSLSRSSSVESRSTSPDTSILRARRSRTLPRLNLHQEMDRASSSSADPA